MKILITGGCGYVGSELIKVLLLKSRYKIINFDTQWFGNYLENNKNLLNIKKDIRNIPDKFFKNIDIVIHLANIANDPAVELNPILSWEVNVLTSMKLINQSIKQGVKKFIYASSGSVYGIKKEKKVSEDLELLPISTYNKTKMISERVLMSFKEKITINCIRPATVCGLSARMRFDLTVNLLTLQALKNKKITLFGGNQIRPNIHIKDMVRVYEFFINKNINSGFYNAGFENLKIKDIAQKIKNKIETNVIKLKSNDLRSYRQDSTKLLNLGFKKKYSVEDAIDEIVNAYNSDKLKDHQNNYTVQWMKKLKIK
jgi:nucleoside-diphosphate-sugar epimerase